MDKLNAIGSKLLPGGACGIAQQDARVHRFSEVVGADTDPLRSSGDGAKGALKRANVGLINVDGMTQYDPFAVRVRAVNGIGRPATTGIGIINKNAHLIIAISRNVRAPGRSSGRGSVRGWRPVQKAINTGLRGHPIPRSCTTPARAPIIYQGRARINGIAIAAQAGNG